MSYLDESEYDDPRRQRPARRGRWATACDPARPAGLGRGDLRNARGPAPAAGPSRPPTGTRRRRYDEPYERRRYDDPSSTAHTSRPVDEPPPSYDPPPPYGSPYPHDPYPAAPAPTDPSPARLRAAGLPADGYDQPDYPRRLPADGPHAAGVPAAGRRPGGGNGYGPAPDLDRTDLTPVVGAVPGRAGRGSRRRHATAGPGATCRPRSASACGLAAVVLALAVPLAAGVPRRARGRASASASGRWSGPSATSGVEPAAGPAGRRRRADERPGLVRRAPTRSRFGLVVTVLAAMVWRLADGPAGTGRDVDRRRADRRVRAVPGRLRRAAGQRAGRRRPAGAGDAGRAWCSPTPAATWPACSSAGTRWRRRSARRSPGRASPAR